MHVLWGVLIAAVGLFMVICSTMRSEFIVYRLLAHRAKVLWGENAHRFLQVSGAIVVVVGVLVALGHVG